MLLGKAGTVVTMFAVFDKEIPANYFTQQLLEGR